MLRKKLLVHLGLLVVGFVAGAVVSIALLQAVLGDLDALKTASGGPGGVGPAPMAAPADGAPRVGSGEMAERTDALAQVSSRLRTLIVALAIAALAMTNVAIFVLLRIASIILRPVGELIDGTRELAAERFATRVSVHQGDEFDELAGAFNSMAGQLAANEERKVEALHQLAVTLNHELNNVINIIELRLCLADRRAGSDPLLGSHLGEIRQNLDRMARTVASLKDVRRIVLTDYLPGETMLDLPRSIAPAGGASDAPGSHPPETHA